jgi:hypothetical protein
LYRTEEGVREHGRLHYQQDCITDSCFNKVDPEEPGTEAACPSPCPHAAREVHYHCRMVSSIVYIIQEGGMKYLLGQGTIRFGPNPTLSRVCLLHREKKE